MNDQLKKRKKQNGMSEYYCVFDHVYFIRACDLIMICERKEQGRNRIQEHFKPCASSCLPCATWHQHVELLPYQS